MVDLFGRFCILRRLLAVSFQEFGFGLISNNPMMRHPNVDEHCSRTY
jgi:hypothetical protein